MSSTVAGAVSAPPPSSAFRLIATLGGISMLSGLLVVMTYQLTRPRILENQRVALERAVFSVLPGAVQREDLVLASGETVMGGRDAEGAWVGFAIAGEARGYQDIVRILYGFDPWRNRVIGMTVLQSTETPGLGDRIIRDPAFHANFKDLDVSQPVQVVRQGEKTEPWQIDGISGATVSSVAVGRAIENGAELRAAILAQLPEGATP